MRQNHKPSFNLFLYFLCTIMLGIVFACVKPKVNTSLNTTFNERIPNSSIKLYNVSGADITNIIAINNIAITGSNPSPLALSIFPSLKWGVNTSFTIPSSLVDKSGNAHIIFTVPNIITTTLVNTGNIQKDKMIDTILHDDPVNPLDYYFDGVKFYIIPRNIASISNSQNFKIRILNLGVRDTLFYNPNDDFHSYGALTLVYNDGSLISPSLSAVVPGTASDYIEMPYGSYQFKLYKASQTGIGIDLNSEIEGEGFVGINYLIAPPGIDLPPPYYKSGPQQGGSSFVRLFKPGGIYTILVIPKARFYKDINGTLFFLGFSNNYRILTDNSPPINTYFAKIRGVNAVPLHKLHLTMDDVSFVKKDSSNTSTLGFGSETEEKIVIQGNHTFKVLDESEKVLVERTLYIYPYDNTTAWMYSKSGNIDLAFSSMDMSGSSFITGSGTAFQDDGTNGSNLVRQFGRSSSIYRFLNMTADVPFINFTNDNMLFTRTNGTQYSSGLLGRYDTIVYSQATIKVPQGFTDINEPYVNNINIINGITFIRAYSAGTGSTPQVPGDILNQVKPISPIDFMVNPLLSPSVPISPQTEIGAYTIALIGSTQSMQAEDRARFIIIRYTK